jgi:glycosyltransferase involved in cell wall biosynthesis
MGKPHILYISYDGMLEPLGQSQVLAYLERLSGDYCIHLMSYEKRSDWQDRPRRKEIADRIANAGITWHPLRYHKRPTAPATAFDIMIGTATAVALAARYRVSIVHARSYVAAMIGLAVKAATGAKFLFDMRGLWADERVDAGLWSREGGLYRFAKRMERRYLQAADQVVTLTRASQREIASFPYLAARAPAIAVIPTCADLDRFSRSDGPEGPYTFGFVGAAGTWSLIEEVIALYAAVRVRVPEARLLIVNRGEHELIRERLGAQGVDPAAVELTEATHAEVPALVSRMHVAAAVRKPAYSQVACAPTKLAEYLGCGVPCVVNRGVGDVVEIVTQDRVGVVLEGFTDRDRAAAADSLIALSREPDIRQRCVESARRRFSLEDGVAVYDAIYRSLSGGDAM